LEAISSLHLDKVLILLEKIPHRKQKISSKENRQKIIELSIIDHDQIHYFDVDSDHITFNQTPKLILNKYPGAKFFMIIGEDLLDHIENWEGFFKFQKKHQLAVVARSDKIK